MTDLFLLTDNRLQKYNGGILKRLIDDKIVKVISNPTEDDLRDFGYMELVLEENIPEYDPETQMIETSYEIREGKIYENLKVVDIVPEEMENVDDLID